MADTLEKRNNLIGRSKYLLKIMKFLKKNGKLELSTRILVTEDQQERADQIFDNLMKMKDSIAEHCCPALTEIQSLISCINASVDMLNYKLSILDIAQQEIEIFRPPQRETAHASRRKRRTNRKRKIIQDAKRCPCMDCGFYIYGQMTFDHKYDNKVFTIGDFRDKSYQDIREEINKCDVVCRKCHDLREHKRGRMFQIKGV